MNRQELACVLSVCRSSHCVGSVKGCACEYFCVWYFIFTPPSISWTQKTGNVSKEFSCVKRFNCSNAVISHFILQSLSVQAVFYKCRIAN